MWKSQLCSQLLCGNTTAKQYKHNRLCVLLLMLFSISKNFAIEQRSPAATLEHFSTWIWCIMLKNNSATDICTFVKELNVRSSQCQILRSFKSAKISLVIMFYQNFFMDFKFFILQISQNLSFTGSDFPDFFPLEISLSVFQLMWLYMLYVEWAECASDFCCMWHELNVQVIFFFKCSTFIMFVCFFLSQTIFPLANLKTQTEFHPQIYMS